MAVCSCSWNPSSCNPPALKALEPATARAKGAAKATRVCDPSTPTKPGRGKPKSQTLSAKPSSRKRFSSPILHCSKGSTFTLPHRSQLELGLEDKSEKPSVYSIMARTGSIYFYVPNIIGYFRILCNLVAFGVSFSNRKLFTALYLISFVCDELDGRFARLLNQTSTFGAVLDMVTDRVSTAGLLVVLSHYYKKCFGLFLGLLALDISSHWLQMYSTFLANKSSHKDVSDSKSKLLRAYYRYRLFMGYCCVGAEMLYLILYLLAEERFGSVIEVASAAAAQKSPWVLLGLLALPGWAIKQWVNLVQARNAADICVLHDVQNPKNH